MYFLTVVKSKYLKHIAVSKISVLLKMF